MGHNENRRTIGVETLEARHLLTSVGELTEPVALYATAQNPAEVPNADIRDAASGCPANVASVSFDPNLPAPVLVDFNLDGRFTSEDFITFFQNDRITNQGDQGTGAADLPNDLGLLESMQWFPYNAPDPLVSSDPCAIYVLASDSDPTLVSREDTYDADGETVRETIIYIGRGDSLRFRGSQYFDTQGQLRRSTMAMYRLDTVYSSLQSTYDAEGRQQQYATQLFNDDGTVRRRTNSEVHYAGSATTKSTEVEYFDELGRTTSRAMNYYDFESRRVATEEFQYERGELVSSQRARLNERGTLATDLALDDPREWPTSNASDSTDLATLVELHESFQAARYQLAPSYRDVLRMNSLPSQKNLEALLEDSTLKAEEKDRYQKLNEYFELSIDLSAAVQKNDFSSVIDQYPDLVVQTTGDWTDAFRQFVDTEGLTMPIAPLRLAQDPHQFAPETVGLLADRYGQTREGRLRTYFQTLANGADEHVRGLLESMRLVKSTIKQLEYKTYNSFPLLESISAEDDSKTLDLQEFVLLTSWYFFERTPEGYLRDEVSEEILRERVRTKMTNEDVFYAMDLESWPLKGPASVVQNSLKQLKRAADLIHQFNPNLLIGYYRLLPTRAPNAAYVGPSSLAFADWQAGNDRNARALGDSIDVVYPSLYVLHTGNGNTTTEQRWNVFATETIAEARRLSGNKPVFPFLAFDYHRNGWDASGQRPKNPKAWESIEPEFFLYQLASLSTLSDGVVLYDGPRPDWQDIVDTGLVEAIDLFQQVSDRGATEQLLEFYEKLFTRYHDELIDKLNLELRLRDKRWEVSQSSNRQDYRLTALLRREAYMLEYELNYKIQIWPMVTDFVREILEN